MPSLSNVQSDFAKQQLLGGGLESNQGYQQGLNYLLSLISGSPEAFQKFSAPYQEHFEQFTAPGIAERFAGMGTGAGASSSSGLYNSLAQAGRSLETDLASMFEQQRMNSLSQLLPFLQQPYSNKLAALQYKKPQKQGSNLWGTAGSLIGSGIGAYFGGPAGAQAGAGIGSATGNYIGQT